MEHAFKSLADWLVDYLAERIAKCSGRPSDEIAARIVEGMQSGVLATAMWVVERLDGTRLLERGFTRTDFFSWCVWAGGLDIDPKDHDQVWPPEIFKDNRTADIDKVTVRWRTHAGGYPAPDIHDALWAVIYDLAVFRWSQMDLSIGRNDFVAWYQSSPLSSTQSVIADTIRAVSADELWPPTVSGDFSEKSPVISWHLLSRAEAVRRAAAEKLPQGYRAGMHMKTVKKVLGDYIAANGGQRPSDKTIERELVKMKPGHQALSVFVRICPKTSRRPSVTIADDCRQL